MRYHCFKGMSPVVLTFVRILRVSFIIEDNGDVIKTTIVTLAWKVLKKVLLHACFFRRIFPIIIFLTILSELKVINSLTYVLQFGLIRNEQIYNAFIIAVTTMITNIFMWTEAEKVMLSLKFIHSWKRLPLHLNYPTDLSRG